VVSARDVIVDEEALVDGNMMDMAGEPASTAESVEIRPVSNFGDLQLAQDEDLPRGIVEDQNDQNGQEGVKDDGIQADN